jgi:ribosome biogenesis GTPase
MMATVYKSTGSWYIVQDENGKVFNARIKGKFKMDNITSTNPVAVGDVVLADMENELENTLTITDIASRKNYITRSSPHNRNQHHIIASNLDQSLLFATLKEPKTSLGFIDRFLITSEAYHVPSILVFNKSDLYKEKELSRFNEVKEIYEAIGYKVLLISIEKNIGIEEVKSLLKDQDFTKSIENTNLLSFERRPNIKIEETSEKISSRPRQNIEDARKIENFLSQKIK